MADLVLKFNDSHENKTKEQLLEVVEQELNRFSTFMERIGDWKARGSLTDRERILLRTYLLNKASGRIDEVA